MHQLFTKVVMIVAILGFQQISALPIETQQAAFKKVFLEQGPKLRATTCKDLDVILEEASLLGLKNSNIIRNYVEEVANEKHEQMKKAKSSCEEEAAANAMVYATRIYYLMLHCAG